MDRGSTLQSTISVVKYFFQAPGPGQTAAAQAQKLVFAACAHSRNDNLILLREVDMHQYTLEGGPHRILWVAQLWLSFYINLLIFLTPSVTCLAPLGPLWAQFVCLLASLGTILEVDQPPSRFQRVWIW